MHMAFLEAGAGQAHKSCLFPQGPKAGAAGIAHGRAHAAHQLMQDGAERALVGHPALDAFRHQFVDGVMLLKVAVGGAVLL